MIIQKVELILLISCQQIVQPELRRRDDLLMHLRLHWTHVEPMPKQSSETTISRFPILSLRMSLENLLSSQAFNNDLKIQMAFRSKSSTKWDMFWISKNETTAHKLKIREKVDVVSNVSMKLLVLLTTKTNSRNWTTKSNRNVTYAANFLCKVHHKSTKYVCEDCFVADEQTLARNIYYNFQCFVIYSTLFLKCNWTVCSWNVIKICMNRKLETLQ